MRTKLQVNRDEKTQKIKSIIVNDKYEFKGDKKIYDVTIVGGGIVGAATQAKMYG